jgi:chemotaxis response regulator CheB
MSTREPVSAESGKVKLPAKSEIDQFPIAGIGASSDGLEALEQFFTHYTHLFKRTISRESNLGKRIF